MRRKTSGWFGQIIQRSRRWRKDVAPAGNTAGRTASARASEGREQQVRLRCVCRNRKPLTTHQFYDGTQHPWEFQAGVASGAIAQRSDTVYGRGWKTPPFFRSTDGGENWKELPGLRGQRHRPQVAAGRGGMCLHTIILDPSNPERIFIAISAAGRFEPMTAEKLGNRSIADCARNISPAQCGGRPLRSPHRDEPSRPGVLFMQKHWDVMRSDDAAIPGKKSAVTCLLTLDS